MPKVVVPVAEEILRAAERRKAVGGGEDVAQFLAELSNVGCEHRLRQLYQRFETREIRLGYFAIALGLSVRDLSAALEQRGLATSNINAQPTKVA